jgi:hypothetical protein
MMEAMMPASDEQTDEFEKLEAKLLALGGETALAGPWASSWPAGGPSSPRAGRGPGAGGTGAGR